MISEIKTIDQAGDLKGKRVFLRADFNVPIKDGQIEETLRIDKTIPTIKSLKEKGAIIILASHIESGEPATLKPVYEYLKKFFDLSFISGYTNENLEYLKVMKEGDISLLENLRANDGEKNNDESFAKVLASLADIYVNDAFAVSHREHASIVSVPKFLPHYAGPLLTEEIKNLSMAFSPPKPFLFILGGLKFETKLPLLEKFLELADDVFVGGALANDLLKAKGMPVGKSIVSDKAFDFGKILKSKKLNLPIDIVVQNGEKISTKKPEEVLEYDFIYDIGAKSVKLVDDLASSSKFVLWNGPMGNFEKGFKDGTLGTAKAISESDAKSIVGGGDTLAAIKELGSAEKFSFISTAGGAMLEFLAKGTLPGIEVLKR